MILTRRPLRLFFSRLGGFLFRFRARSVVPVVSVHAPNGESIVDGDASRSLFPASAHTAPRERALCATNQQLPPGLSLSAHPFPSAANTENSGCSPRCTGGLDTMTSKVSSAARPLSRPRDDRAPRRVAPREIFAFAAADATASASSNVTRARGARRRIAAANTPDPEQKSNTARA